MSTGSGNKSLPLEVTPFLLALNAAVLVETLLYGIHFVLFCICAFILLRDRRSTSWVILGSAFIMFALSTADISITIHMMTHHPSNSLPELQWNIYPKHIIYVVDNLIAELILLYRCYMIWGRSKYLLAVAGLVVVADTVWGFLSMTAYFIPSHSKYLPIYLWSVFAINIVITMVSAGRIFWVSKIARPILGHRGLRRYHFIIAILIESSVVYCVCLLTFLLFSPQSSYFLIPVFIGIRVVAIMPTLLIVQIGLDHLVRVSDTGDCERPATSIVLDTVVVTTHEIQDTLHSDVHEGSRSF